MPIKIIKHPILCNLILAVVIAGCLFNLKCIADGLYVAYNNYNNYGSFSEQKAEKETIILSNIYKPQNKDDKKDD